jgi:hypothetical protein
VTHEAYRRLAAAAALGDLEPRERARWERHRATCPDCRALEAQLGDVLSELALSAPGRVPPPSLLDGIRAAIHADADRA